MFVFQFHKGTIKTKEITYAQVKQYYFNSIKVQLKQTFSGTPATKRLFQFHKGTIKTYYKFDVYEPYKLFQFHKGTIKTCSRAVKSILLLDFNSIKVQLKLIKVKRESHRIGISIP